MKNGEKCPRKYYRKCGYCGHVHEQGEMVRTNKSPNGWACDICYEENRNVEYETEEDNGIF